MHTDKAVHKIKRLLPVLALGLGACDSAIGPGFWVAEPDTLLIYSASVPEYLGFRSAVDLAADPVRALPIEASGLIGNWDIALTHENGELALVPASAFEGLESRAAIAPMPGADFEDLARAPSDTSAYSSQAVILEPNEVYVVRSRRANCGYTTGYRYAKVKTIDVDAAAGTLRFAVIRNPYCDDRSFVPPEQ